jgi:hypothetical protein
MAPGSTQPLTEMNTRNHHGCLIMAGGEGRPASKAGRLTAICEPFSRKCGSLDLSQAYGPSRPIIGIPLLFFLTFAISRQREVPEIRSIPCSIINSENEWA